MEVFSFSSITQITNFLNNKVLTILRLINNHPNQITHVYLNLLLENKVKISKTQVYRYIDCLVKYDLVDKSHYLNRGDVKGYLYKINENGIELLYTLSKRFEQDKIVK